MKEDVLQTNGLNQILRTKTRYLSYLKIKQSSDYLYISKYVLDPENGGV